MSLPADPVERHRSIAAHFAATTEGVTDWDAPSPVPEWRVRDVVRHLVEWFPSFLEGGAGITLPAVPDVDEDPVGAWREHAAHVQAVLDDPATADLVLSNPNTGDVPLPDAIDRFYTNDVFMHTWDLARGAGLDDRLDDDECARMVGGMEPMAEMLSSSGHFGTRVAVPDDADAQTRILGIIGRDPSWAPTAPPAGG
ncbi:MAG: TIGR03086 family metal-binding protein [Nocardioides sp.]